MRRGLIFLATLPVEDNLLIPADKESPGVVGGLMSAKMQLVDRQVTLWHLKQQALLRCSGSGAARQGTRPMAGDRLPVTPVESAPVSEVRLRAPAPGPLRHAPVESIRRSTSQVEPPSGVRFRIPEPDDLVCEDTAVG